MSSNARAGFPPSAIYTCVSYTWKLREIMADRRIHTATELVPLLRERWHKRTFASRPELSPLFDLLVAMEKPGSGLAWLTMRRNHPGNAAVLVQRLAPGQIPLTRDAFHELQPWRTAAHLENS